MTDDAGKTEWIKFRVEPSRKVAWYAAADAHEIDFSEWAREALDTKLEAELGITVGANVPAPRVVPPFQPAHEE